MCVLESISCFCLLFHLHNKQAQFTTHISLIASYLASKSTMGQRQYSSCACACVSKSKWQMSRRTISIARATELQAARTPLIKMAYYCLKLIICFVSSKRSLGEIFPKHKETIHSLQSAINYEYVVEGLSPTTGQSAHNLEQLLPFVKKLEYGHSQSGTYMHTLCNVNLHYYRSISSITRFR